MRISDDRKQLSGQHSSGCRPEGASSRPGGGATDVGQAYLQSALLDSIPDCIALVIEKGTHKIVAANRLAREIGSGSGQTCFSACAKRDDECPSCLAPQLWATGQQQRREVQSGSTWYEAVWAPLSEDSYVHYLFDITERKQVEEALRRARRSVDFASDHTMWIDSDGRVIDVNQSACERLGYSRDELLRMSVVDITVGVSLETWPDHWRELKAHGPLTFEDEYRTKDGETYPVEISSAFFEHEGHEYALGVIRDISERKRAEAATRASEDRYRTLVNLSPDAIIVNVDGKYAFANPAAARLLGAASPRDLVGQDVFQRIHPDYREVVAARDAAVRAGRGAPSQELKVLRLDGTPVHVEVCAAAGEYDGHPATHVVFHDISERKEADAKVAAGQERLRELNLLQESLLTSMPLSEKLKLVTETVIRVMGADFARIWIVRPGDRCEAGCAHAQVGEGPDVCRVRDRCLHLVSSSGCFGDREAYDHGRVPFGCYKIGAIAAGQEPGYLTNDVQNDAGVRDREWARELGLVSFGGYRLSETDSTALGVLAVYTRRPISADEDSTLHGIANATSQVLQAARAEEALREAEQLLRQSQKMEAVGQLAGGIAHDFNNLLAVILGYGELLLSHEDLVNSAARADVEQIKRAAERASALTRQILAFSRRQALRPMVVPLDDIIAGMAPLLRRTLGEDIELVIRTGRNVGGVEVDVHQFEQVIMNLAVNARDAMSPGGRLTLTTAGVELDSEFCRTHPGVAQGDHVMLMVSDTGGGMDAATLARIFEPFFTTKPPGMGTGLGLATVYGIVKQSGGSIFVESEPGRGTRFTIYLRTASKPAQEEASSVAPATASVRDKTVLVVDDEASLRDLMVRVLEELGCRVLHAGTAAEALRVASESGADLDLLLTDVVLPGDLQGNDLAHEITLSRPELPVLYVSGYTRDALVSAGRLNPGVNLLEKPFSPEALRVAVRAALDRLRIPA